MDLQGTVAIVTGSSSGIGAASARLLASRGARLVINCARSVEAGEEVAEQCRAAGSEAVLCQADVSIDADCRRLAQTALDRWDRIDVLVNSAGTTKFVAHHDLDGLSSEDFSRILAVNTLGPFQMVRAAAPHLKASGEGAVVNVSSVAGLLGTGSCIAYAASKAALNMMTVSLARVLAPEVRINTICPAFVQGRWLQDALGEKYEAHKAAREKGSLLRKAPTPEEVAETVLWLIEGAALSTGQVLLTDAGRTLEATGSKTSRGEAGMS